jgi:PTS system mannose-specific IIA component
MIGVLILTLGRVGEGLLEESTMIMGKAPEAVKTFTANCNQKPDIIIGDLRKILDQFKGCDGILILADIYGATHVNAACQLLEHDKIELVAGVNLPMLVRVLNYRDTSLHELVDLAVSGGRTGVIAKNQSEHSENRRG